MDAMYLIARAGGKVKYGHSEEGNFILGNEIYDHKDKTASLKSLPASCWESAEMLDKQRGIYERHGVFPANIIDGVS